MLKIGDRVKVIQKNAPYKFYGSLGKVVEVDGKWYKVLINDHIDKKKKGKPYESFFLLEHLEKNKQIKKEKGLKIK